MRCKSSLIFLSILFNILCYGQVVDFSFDYESNNIVTCKSSTIKADIIGNSSYVTDRFGNECRSLFFDGNTYLKIKNTTSLQFSSSYSASVWVKLEDDELDWITLICKGGQSYEDKNSPAYRVQLTNNTISANTSSTKDIGTIKTNFPNNKWFHLTFVYSKNNTIKIYVNANLVGEYYIYGTLGKNNEDLFIGRDIPGGDEFFVGTLDDLKLFPFELSHNEIKSIYNDKWNEKLGNACYIPPKKTNVNFNWDDFEEEEIVTPINNDLDINWDDFALIRSITSDIKDTTLADINWNDFNQENDEEKHEPVHSYKIPSDSIKLLNKAYKKKLVELNIQENFKTKSNSISISLYDHKKVDNDTVSVYLNDSLVIENYELKYKLDKNNIQIPFSFTKRNQRAFISLEAKNFGSTGVKINTVAISIYDGEDIYERQLTLRKINQKVTLEIIFSKI